MNTPRTLLSLKRPQSDGPILEERLHKVLANAGLGSRRLLEERIQAGEIRVNGNVAEIGSSVRAGDRVELDGKLFVAINDNAEHAQVIVFHKPDGVVTTRDDPEGRPTVFEQLPHLKGARWIAVGRLDINTTGLLLLTTDGALAHRLMHPSTEIEREYICRVHGEVPDEALERLKSGVQLDDGPASFEELAVISRGPSHSWFRVVIREGRNREVRRMWETQGLMVSRLKRIRYGNVELPRGLLKGRSETLDAEQVKGLRALAGAVESEPTLTLQPVIGQRRAPKAAPNEFRPAPKTQQAWTGAYHDEGRELRAFDRIREDAPARPGGQRKFGKKKPQRGPGGGNAPNRDNRNERRGPGGNAQNRDNRNGRRGAGRGQTQIGVYQPGSRWANENTGGGANRPRRAKPAQWRPPVTGVPGEREDDRGAKRFIAGLRAEKTRYVPRGEPRAPRPGQGVPRDDIGNRLGPPRDGQGKRRGKPRK
ncbi:MAG: rRNA pseudouridine synthase [Proteobacteria bacterium]|nr:rRNA pseudouridine synthase [Pseudomonadota bacterium]